MIQVLSVGSVDSTTRRLPFRRLRHVVESLRQQHRAGGAPFAVIALDCRTSPSRPIGRLVEQLDSLDTLLAADWAHEKVVGWLERNTLAIVLPNITPHEAWEYLQQVSDFCGIGGGHICVYASERTSFRVGREDRPIVVESIEDLLTKPIPAWKRAIDIVLASAGLLVAAPFLLLAGLMIKLTSPGPIMFRQARVGYGGQPFKMYKLRTMRVGADAEKDALRARNEQDGLAFKIANDPRITPVGRFLRRTSIDELPQLINVLRGDMTIVGPRPLPCSDWEPTELWVCRRHDVLPGITCTWQVTGRSNVSFEEWMWMDVDYVETHSFWKDITLLVRTIPAVLLQRGAS